MEIQIVLIIAWLVQSKICYFEVRRKFLNMKNDKIHINIFKIINCKIYWMIFYLKL